ncbi:uncharacterized protein LOC144584086 [Pogona vitticeps]
MPPKDKPSPRRGPFRLCTACSRKLPFQDGHSLCLYCLGESHSVSNCRHCKRFTKVTLKARQQRLRYSLWKQTLSASQPSEMEVAQSSSSVRSEIRVVQSTSLDTLMDVPKKAKAKSKTKTSSKKVLTSASTGSISPPKPEHLKKKKQKLKGASTSKEVTLVVPPISSSLPSPFLEDSSRDRESASEPGASLPPRQEPLVVVERSPTASQIDKIISGLTDAPRSPILPGQASRSRSSTPGSLATKSPTPSPSRPGEPNVPVPPRRPTLETEEDTIPKKPKRHRKRKRTVDGDRRRKHRRRDYSSSDSDDSRERRRSRRRHRHKRDYTSDSSSTSRDRRRRRKRTYSSSSSTSTTPPPKKGRRRKRPLPDDEERATPAEGRSTKHGLPTPIPADKPSAPLPSPSRPLPTKPPKPTEGIPQPVAPRLLEEEDAPDSVSSSEHEDEGTSDASLETPVPAEPLGSDAADIHPSSPSEDFSSYPQMVARMAATLRMEVEKSPSREDDLIFGDIHKDRSRPVSLSYVPELMDLITGYWDHPADSPTFSRRTENMYRVHGPKTECLLKHPAPNSLVVESSAGRLPTKGHPTPTNKEGRDLEVLGRRLYSMTTFALRALNYLVAMGAYQKQLWARVLPALQVAPEDIRQVCLDAYAEAQTVSKHQRLASRHVADANARNLASIITLRRHAWLRSANIMDDIKARIKNLAFDATGLFSEKTDENLKSLHESKKTAKSYAIQQQPRPSKPQWRTRPQQQSYQQGTTSTYRQFRPQPPARSSQASSSASSFKTHSKRQSFKPSGRKFKQYL